MNNRIRVAVTVFALTSGSFIFAASPEAQTPASDGTAAVRGGSSVGVGAQSVEHRWTNNFSRSFYGQ